MLAAITLTSTSKEGGAPPGKKCDDAEVLILWAGIAGIAAAKTLSEHKVTNFLILEAENRIGGRVKNTVLKSGVRVELGANWNTRNRPQST